MISQHAQAVSRKDGAARAYATPQLSYFGSIRDVTSGSLPANPKGPSTAENAPGVGTVRKP